MRPINPFLVGISAAILRPVCRFAFGLRVDGREHLPTAGPVLLAANHISTLDPPVIGVAQLPGRIHFMAKKELFRGPAGWFFSRCGAFPVERGGADREAFRTARDVLAAGGRLLMFPEGTRSTDGALGPAWPGAGSLALMDGVTVIPVAIRGTNRWRDRGVRVRFGAPLVLGDLDGARSVRSQAAADRIMQAIGALLRDLDASA